MDGETNEFFFIEVNPRIQVEHTVTEIGHGDRPGEVARFGLRRGYELHESADRFAAAGGYSAFTAWRCSAAITTEDPANNFMPDYGQDHDAIVRRRDMGCGWMAGRRMAGAVITPYFDSLLVKLTALGHDLTRRAADGSGAARSFGSAG